MDWYDGSRWLCCEYRRNGFYGLDRSHGRDGLDGLDRLDGSCRNGNKHGRDG